MSKRLQGLISAYGPVAFGTYFTIFGLVLTGFAVAIAAGMQVDSAGGGIGTLGAAYVATKMTQPFRIGATLVLTPVVARAIAALRRRGRSDAAASTGGQPPA